jgi:hypothetical protein
MSFKKLALSVALIATAASANPWTECGIGGAVGSLIKDNPTASKVIASVSNITWDWGTTATTSAVSTPDLCANKSVAAAKFINDTYGNLETETANGQGQNLSTLLDIVEVNGQARAEVTATVRKEFAAVVSSESYLNMTKTQKAQAYHSILMNALIEA